MRLSYVFIFIALLAGCESNTSSNSSSTPPGDIVGRIGLRNARNEALPNHSGATIKIIGTLFSAVSDSEGVFTLRNVPAGTYVLSIEKEGFTTKKMYNIQHTGNGVLYLQGYISSASYDASIVQIPTEKPNLNLRPFANTDWYYDSMWVDTSGVVRHLYVHDTTLIAIYSTDYNVPYSYPTFYFSLTPNIHPEDHSTYLYAAPSYKDAGTYSASIMRDSLVWYGMSSGTKVFVISAAGIDSYFDVTELHYVVTYGFNSEVKSFVVP